MKNGDWLNEKLGLETFFSYNSGWGGEEGVV